MQYICRPTKSVLRIMKSTWLCITRPEEQMKQTVGALTSRRSPSCTLYADDSLMGCIISQLTLSCPTTLKATMSPQLTRTSGFFLRNSIGGYFLSSSDFMVDIHTMSTSDNEVQDENNCEYDVVLVRYMLSYSASCPRLFRSLVRWYEKSMPTSWLSHYTLAIGDCYFDLYREGSIPFTSTAYFRVLDTRDRRQMEQAFGNKQKWIEENVKLGTTSLTPQEIISKSEL